jgi:succinate dehydrogenase / fumarate reductase flavoprotein subunit
MQRALEAIDELRRRAAAVGVPGNREYNPGWHTALDLPSLLTVSEAITRTALDRRESRGAQFRDDFPAKDPAYGSFNIIVRRGRSGEMHLVRAPIPAMPDELKRIIAEEK